MSWARFAGRVEKSGWMEMVISNHFPCKDFWNHPIETTNEKWLFRVPGVLYPIGSMYGIFTYICHKNQPNVGNYTILGSSGYNFSKYVTDVMNPK